jgi:predicted outer membrane repeat protein
MSLTHHTIDHARGIAARALVLIDSAIPDYSSLVVGVVPNVEIAILNAQQDGVEQLLALLANRPDVTAIHLFAHGSPGTLNLGNAQLSLSTIDRYAASPNWSALAGIDLVLYSCDLAAGEAGKAFLHKLQMLTGSRIATSSTRIGNAALNGNWELDVRIGEIEPAIVLEPEVMTAYAGVLATITVTNTNNSGAGSLRDAISTARNGDTIAFVSSLANRTITLGSQLDISAGKNLMIDGTGAPGLTISGNNTTRILQLNSNQDFPTSLTVKNLTLANGYTSDRGGAIHTTHKGVLTVENVTFNNNTGDKGGGAIFSAFEGALTVTGSKFNGNKATAGNDERGAGAIAFWGPGTLTVRNSEFTGNKGIVGGAINSLNGKLIVENSKFINNDVLAARFDTGKPNDFLRGYGGAIYTDRANNEITIRNSLFEGNQSRAAGGAVHLFADPEDVVTIEGSVFRQNQAIGLAGGESGKAGAITHLRTSLGSGSFTIRNSSIVNNTGNDQGGGLWVNNSRTTIVSSTFSGNKLLNSGFSSVGGAMTLYSPTEIINSTIANNSAGWSGGGVGASGDAPVSVRNTIFFNNTANNPWQIQNHTSKVLTDGGGNLQFPPKATTLGNDFNATNSITIADPRLGALQNVNGTWVHPLLPGSPAIDAGVGGAPATDLFGASRVGRPDIGAFEFGGTIGPVVPLQPTLSINNISLNEGNSGTQTAIFTVSLSSPSASPVTVKYGTANGTAIAGSDYTTASGSLAFNPGETTKTLRVPIVSDTLFEQNETFFVNLTAPTNAALGSSQGTTTILNDDPASLRVSINNISLTEGNQGNKNAAFTVSLSSKSKKAVSVNYATANQTAIAGSDYTAQTGKLTFKPGETRKTINIKVLGDATVEPQETFVVNLSNVINAALGNNRGVASIVNDDVPRTVSINSINLTESNSGTKNATFTVKLSQSSKQTITVGYSTADLGAIAGSDYRAANGKLTFKPGETSKTIRVAVMGDRLAEANETFAVNLSSSTNAILGTRRGIATVVNDDGATPGANGTWFMNSVHQTALHSSTQGTQLSIVTNSGWQGLR